MHYKKTDSLNLEWIVQIYRIMVIELVPCITLLILITNANIPIKP